jgi:hypothetical protein
MTTGKVTTTWDEQVHPDRRVADTIVEAFKHDPLLETILPQAISRPTNVLQPY